MSHRVHDVRGKGAQALMDHIAGWPRDVLAVSAAVPTIAFSGITDVQLEAWDLVEELAPAYGDHWWYISLLAFTRQEQHRYNEVALLAENALACEPASGHAVHALAHVLYETGQHHVGRTWLDHWVAQSGRDAVHRAHFSWHAPLHELALDDSEAARRRYDAQLAPPIVMGVRGLVDASSLLWRWQLSVEGGDRSRGAGSVIPQTPGFGFLPPDRSSTASTSRCWSGRRPPSSRSTPRWPSPPPGTGHPCARYASTAPAPRTTACPSRSSRRATRSTPWSTDAGARRSRSSKVCSRPWTGSAAAPRSATSWRRRCSWG